MKPGTLLASAVFVGSGLAVAGWLFLRQAPLAETAPANSRPVVQPAAKQSPPVSIPAAGPVEATGPLIRSATSTPAPPTTVAGALSKPTAAAAMKPKAPLHDPDARVALSLVGVEPDAERYWVEAINDSSLPAHERQDLIEDLNEEGFSDPKNPTAAELSLIVARLWWIEELAPDALDKVNADAFAEAYKDLANMYARLTRR